MVIGSAPEAFAGWWATRALDGATGLFAGQPIDEAVVTQAYAVAPDAGLGVDAWNATDHRITSDEAGHLRVGDGSRLVTYHFDDLDPRRPYRAATARPRPPLRLSAEPALRALYARYAALLPRSPDDGGEAYPFARLPGGLRVDAAARQAYREAYQAFRLGEGAEPPDPFATGGFRQFVDFLNAPPVEGQPLSRYVIGIYRTWPGISSVFPELDGRDRRPFMDWLNRFGRADGGISSAIELPTVSRHRSGSQPPPRPGGVNVAGYLDADSGLGVAARRLIGSLEAVGVDVHPVTYRRTVNRQGPSGGNDLTAPFPVSIVCVTAEQLPFFRDDVGDHSSPAATPSGTGTGSSSLYRTTS